MSTVQLHVYPKRLVVIPKWRNDQLNYILGIPDRLEYGWPVAVVERLRPTSMRQVLLEVDDELGSVTVSPFLARRLLQALSEAGFEVVEQTRWGWERPRPVPKINLVGYVDRVPARVVAE